MDFLETMWLVQGAKEALGKRGGLVLQEDVREDRTFEFALLPMGETQAEQHLAAFHPYSHRL